jgi:hypothetical protein
LGKEKYCFEVSNRSAALENYDAAVEVIMLGKNSNIPKFYSGGN